MRENIGLFRGKRINNGKWVEGYLLRSKIKERIRYEIYVPFTEEEEKENEGHFLSAIGGIWHKVDPDTIGECTGLSTLNGELIFEGDILSAKVRMKVNRRESDFWGEEYDIEEQRQPWSVEYKNFNARNGWFCYGKDRRFKVMLTNSVIINAEPIIIGNIHDNPELLKGGEGE